MFPEARPRGYEIEEVVAPAGGYRYYCKRCNHPYGSHSGGLYGPCQRHCKCNFFIRIEDVVALCSKPEEYKTKSQTMYGAVTKEGKILMLSNEKWMAELAVNKASEPCQLKTLTVSERKTRGKRKPKVEVKTEVSTLGSYTYTPYSPIIRG